MARTLGSNKLMKECAIYNCILLLVQKSYSHHTSGNI